jgi:hypothetical protein
LRLSKLKEKEFLLRRMAWIQNIRKSSVTSARKKQVTQKRSSLNKKRSKRTLNAHIVGL